MCPPKEVEKRKQNPPAQVKMWTTFEGNYLLLENSVVHEKAGYVLIKGKMI